MSSILFDDLLQARQRIAGLVRQTPLEHSPSLSRLAGVPVWLKLESQQATGSFKLRGQRVLRCAPLHHHYEFGGMAEAKVTVRFWIVAVILAVFSVASLKLR